MLLACKLDRAVPNPLVGLSEMALVTVNLGSIVCTAAAVTLVLNAPEVKVALFNKFDPA